MVSRDGHPPSSVDTQLVPRSAITVFGRPRRTVRPERTAAPDAGCRNRSTDWGVQAGRRSGRRRAGTASRVSPVGTGQANRRGYSEQGGQAMSGPRQTADRGRNGHGPSPAPQLGPEGLTQAALRHLRLETSRPRAIRGGKAEDPARSHTLAFLAAAHRAGRPTRCPRQLAVAPTRTDAGRAWPGRDQFRATIAHGQPGRASPARRRADGARRSPGRARGGPDWARLSARWGCRLMGPSHGAGGRLRSRTPPPCRQPG